MIWLDPKYYVSPVGVPCCHCRMKKSFSKSTEDSYKKKIQDKSSVRNTLPEKNGLNQNKQKRKNSLCQAMDG